MGLLHFWKTVPRLVPKFLRFLGDAQHFVPVHFRKTSPPAAVPYAGSSKGMKPRTELETELDRVQSCLVADLECVVEALAAVEARKNATRHRKTDITTIHDVLKPVVLGPSSVETLVTKGRRLIRERETQWNPAYRGYLTPAKALRLAAADDAKTLLGLRDAHVKAIELVGCARNAAQATANALRATFIETAKGKRRSDRTISRDMLDNLPDLSIMQKILLSFVSGVNASHIWHYNHGAPETIDYHRVFDLAVFAGRLTRGEPAPITWDLVRYLKLHKETPNIDRWWRVMFFPNTVPVHAGLEWICDRIESVCGLDTLMQTLGRCDQPGQSGTLRLSPAVP